jgi:hypothetical protein
MLSIGLSVYKGSKWKGQEIKIEEAKMDYKEREALRRQKIEEQEEKKKKRLLRWNDSEGFHAKDMSLVTDNNMNPKRGWKRGRYGRAILQMKLTKSDGTKVNQQRKTDTCIHLLTYFFLQSLFLTLHIIKIT